MDRISLLEQCRNLSRTEIERENDSLVMFIGGGELDASAGATGETSDRQTKEMEAPRLSHRAGKRSSGLKFRRCGAPHAGARSRRWGFDLRWRLGSTHLGSARRGRHQLHRKATVCCYAATRDGASGATGARGLARQLSLRITLILARGHVVASTCS
jgi:hypothetical protein